MATRKKTTTPVLRVIGINTLTIATLPDGTLIRNPSGRVIVPVEAVPALRARLAELDAIPRPTPRPEDGERIDVAPGVSLFAFGDGDVVIHVRDGSPMNPGQTVELEIGEIGRVVGGLGT